MIIKDIPFIIENCKTTLDFILTGNLDLLNEDIIEKLKKEKISIFFNDITADHWIFDFCIDDVWFEGIKVLPDNEHKIILNVFN